MPYLSYFIKCLLHLILFKSVQIYTIQIIKVTYSTLFSFKSDNFYTPVTISLIIQCKSCHLFSFSFLFYPKGVSFNIIVTFKWKFCHIMWNACHIFVDFLSYICGLHATFKCNFRHCTSPENLDFKGFFPISLYIYTITIFYIFL